MEYEINLSIIVMNNVPCNYYVLTPFPSITFLCKNVIDPFILIILSYRVSAAGDSVSVQLWFMISLLQLYLVKV